MRVYLIKNKGQFMTRLLSGNDFDDFFLEKAVIKTANIFEIDGRLNREFFEEGNEELDSENAFRQWKFLKNICYEIIKGKRMPLGINIVLHAPLKYLESDVIKAALWQIRFDGEKLRLVTGTSLKGFSLDNSIEKVWDEKTAMLLNNLSVDFEQE